MSNLKLNGWWRLWIVASVLWLPIAWIIATPQGENAYGQHRPEFLNQLDDAEQASLSRVETLAFQYDGVRIDTASGDKIPPAMPSDHWAQESWETAIGVEMPNGFVLVFSPAVSLEAREQTINSYTEIAAEAANSQRLKQIAFTATLIGSLPLVLLALGLTVAWIRSGFRIN